MSRYSIELPKELKKDAESLATKQGVSLSQFILWALAEKIGSLKKRPDDDDRFPGIAYKVGAAGVPTPVIRGTAIRVQTLVVASREWSMSEEEIAEDWNLSSDRVREALDFYQEHRQEIDRAIQAEVELERRIA